MSILELDRPFLAANRVNFEDAEWWTAEDMVKRWILATKLVGKVLAVMQTQLMAQECGAFDRFKDDYFMAIAKQSILVLLKFADGFTSTRSPDKLIHVLELYGALGSSAPGLLAPAPVHREARGAHLPAGASRSRQAGARVEGRDRRPRRQDPNRLFSGRRRRRPSAGALRHHLRRAAGAAPRGAGPSRTPAKILPAEPRA